MSPENEEAARWGAENYPILRGAVDAACRSGTEGLQHAALLAGMRREWWPCLSRILAMDEPRLLHRMRIGYDAELDGPAGTAWLRLQFRRMCHRLPRAGSWRHAMEELRRKEQDEG